MNRTRIKICGITRCEDAERCMALGADALGLVLVQRSPRHVDLERARDLSRTVGGLTSTIALMMDPDPDEVRRVIDVVRPDMLQFHGSETAQFCEQFDHPYIKALSFSVDATTFDEYGAARAFIVDSHAPGAAGGTGQAFDWRRYPRIAAPVLLAGGLEPGNVAAAVQQVRPYGVDVSSGVESSPGIKDPDKLKQFFSEVARADYRN